jgi:hypothetical protein
MTVRLSDLPARCPLQNLLKIIQGAVIYQRRSKYVELNMADMRKHVYSWICKEITINVDYQLQEIFSIIRQ